MTDLKNHTNLRSVKTVRSEKITKDVPPLPGEYHRARRNLVLFSAILLSWEFVGIEPKSDAAPSLFGMSIGFTNHNAIPFVVFLLVLFFSVRFVVEWQQADKERRKHTFAKVDANVSAGLALLAVGVFTFQTMTQVNIFEQIEALEHETQISLANVFYSIVGLSMILAAKSLYNKAPTDPEARTYLRLCTPLLAILAALGFSVEVTVMVRGGLPNDVKVTASTLLIITMYLYMLIFSYKILKLPR